MPVNTIPVQRDIVDGFTMSASQLLGPQSTRALALGQMDTLRRASAMRSRHYIAPLSSDEPIKAYSQNEYQIGLTPGSYVWGLSFSIFAAEIANAEFVHIQITDACTETGFFSDYVRGINFMTQGSLASNFFPSGAFRAPCLLTQPRLIGDPAKLNVEIYNSSSADLHPQLLICVAEPCLEPDKMEQLFRKAGYAA